MGAAHLPSGVTCTFPQRVIDKRQPRAQPIYPGKTWCGFLALWFQGASLADLGLLRLLTSSQPDVHTMVHLVHYCLQHFRVRVWFEWVDSHSTPSDGFSHAGLEDDWTRHQAWQLSEVFSPRLWSR